MTGDWWQAMRQRLMLTAGTIAPAGVSPAQATELERQMLNQLVRGIWQIQLSSSLIGPALVLWLTLPHIGWWRAVLPALLLFGLNLERMLLLRRMERARRISDTQPQYWAQALTWRTFLSVSTILLWSLFVVQSGNDSLISQVLALLTILSAGAAAQYCSWPPAMWAAITPLLLGMGLALAWLGGVHHLTEAVFAVVLWLVLAAASLRFARTLHREALTRLRNEELVHELHQKHAQAEAAIAARTRFFAAANHDLRQPLQAMGLYLSVLRVDESEQETLARVHQCRSALDQMLETLLELSRMDSGQLRPVIQVFPLQPLLEQLAGMYEAMAGERGLQLRVRPSPCWVRSDPVLLERAVSNLLSNAIRYTRAGGILLGVRRAGAGVRLCVVDTGPGIAPELQDSVFEEFVQLDNPERDPARGHGLGLPTVQRIATVLGHALQLQSRPGHGSCFSLQLPLAEPEPLAATQHPARAQARLQGRALVVEDNLLARDALVQLLSSWGLETEAATHAEEALAAMRRSAFDVVLSDWRLPGPEDGLVVLQGARSLLPGLRLGALVTGEDTSVVEALDPEVLILRKPVRPLRLRALLTQHLSSK